MVARQEDYKQDLLSRFIRSCPEARDSWRSIHLGIFIEPFLSKIRIHEKKYEGRFSANKIAPYGQSAEADIVIVKKSSGNVIGYFYIGEILFMEIKPTFNIQKIREIHAEKLCATSEDFWKQKEKSKYFTIMKIEDFTEIEPFSISRTGMSGWVVLRHPNQMVTEEL